MIIVDADDNFEQRKDEVLKKLNDVGISMSSTYQLGTLEQVNGITIGVYILPDNNGIGSLETLLLKSVRHQSLLQCADSMIQCRKTNDPTFNWNTQNKYDKIKCRLHMNILIVDHDFNYDKTFKSEINFADENDGIFANLKQFINISLDGE